MCRGIGHAPAIAGWTNPPSLAGKRKQPIVSTGRTTKTKETSSENSAVEKGTKLAVDELRRCAITLLLSRQKRLQFFGDDTVEDSGFGITRSVFERGVRHAQSALVESRARL